MAEAKGVGTSPAQKQVRVSLSHDTRLEQARVEGNELLDAYTGPQSATVDVILEGLEGAEGVSFSGPFRYSQDETGQTLEVTGDISSQEGAPGPWDKAHVTIQYVFDRESQVLNRQITVGRYNPERYNEWEISTFELTKKHKTSLALVPILPSLMRKRFIQDNRTACDEITLKWGLPNSPKWGLPESPNTYTARRNINGEIETVRFVKRSFGTSYFWEYAERDELTIAHGAGLLTLQENAQPGIVIYGPEMQNSFTQDATEAEKQIKAAWGLPEPQRIGPNTHTATRNINGEIKTVTFLKKLLETKKLINPSFYVWQYMERDKLTVAHGAGLLTLQENTQPGIAVTVPGVKDRFGQRPGIDKQIKAAWGLPEPQRIGPNTHTATRNINGEIKTVTFFKGKSGPHYFWKYQACDELTVAHGAGLLTLQENVSDDERPGIAVTGPGVKDRFTQGEKAAKQIKTTWDLPEARIFDYTTYTATRNINGEIKTVTFFKGKNHNSYFWKYVLEDEPSIAKVAGLTVKQIDFGAFSRETFDDFIKNNQLDEILYQFQNDPAALMEALRFLYEDILPAGSAVSFVTTLIKLRGTKNGKEEMLNEDRGVNRTAYIQGILKALENGKKLDLSPGNLIRQTHLLIHLSRFSFQRDPAELVCQLQEETQRYRTTPPEFLSSEAAHYLADLHENVATHFDRIQKFTVAPLKTYLYPYQQEGVLFLSSHIGAILGDKAGFGKTLQAIAAAETAGCQKILWVTTAPAKQTVQEEIEEHTFVPKEQVIEITSGDPQQRIQEIENLKERYRIINYENLSALYRDDHAHFDQLTTGLDLLVVDEAQKIDHETSLRSKAVRAIQAPRCWLLTATPYQHSLEDLYTVLHYLRPDEFPNEQAFKETYLQAPEGLVLLHHVMEAFMLRRTERETMAYFKDPSVIPFEVQLADRVPRIPCKIQTPLPGPGAYDLHPEQANILAQLTANALAWATEHNKKYNMLASQGKPPMDWEPPIDIEHLNHLQVYSLQEKAIYMPEKLGLDIENPLWKALDTRVQEHLSQGEKIILWAFNTDVLNKIQTRYQAHGVQRIDGTVQGESRERARHEFQENPEARILAASFEAGGEALTFTAAHCAIYVQGPDSYAKFYQVDGRHERLIGLNNIRHAKSTVTSEWMVPQYSSAFLNSLENPELRTILERGTLVEHTLKRIEGGRSLFHLALEGYGNIEALEPLFHASVAAGIGLEQKKSLEYTSPLSKQTRQTLAIAQAFLPVYRCLNDPNAQDKLAMLIDHLRFYPEAALHLATVMAARDILTSQDLDRLASVFVIPNKAIREALLKHMPQFMEQTANAEASSTASKGDFLAQMTHFLARSEGNTEPAWSQPLTEKLAAQRDTPAKRILQEQYLFGMLGITGNAAAQDILSAQAPNLASLNLEDQVACVYRLGLLARTQSPALNDLRQTEFTQSSAFAGAVQHAVWKTVADITGANEAAVTNLLAHDDAWRGSVDTVIALHAAYQTPGYGEVQGKYQEALTAILENRFHGWRNDNGAIAFQSDAFWEAFAENTQLSVTVNKKTQDHTTTLIEDYASLQDQINPQIAFAETPWISDALQAYRALPVDARQGERRQVEEDLRLFGQAIGQRYGHAVSASPEALTDVLTRHALPNDTPTENILAKKNEIEQLLAWIRLDDEFGQLSTHRVGNIGDVHQLLTHKERVYRGANQDALADSLAALARLTESEEKRGESAQTYTVRESDHPAELIRMGAFADDLYNCFNPNGNPMFNQFITTALGSKNMKLMIVEDSATRPVAIAMMKVKQTEDGETPVLFLERGLSNQGYSFRAEMLQLLKAKQERLAATGTKPLVMAQIRGKVQEDDPWVRGIGAYTRFEYSESTFGLRRSANLRHPGRIVE